MAISLEILLFFSTTIFLFGILGIALNKRNLINYFNVDRINACWIKLKFYLFSVYLDDIIGQVFALYVLTVAAAESGIGLAIITVYYKDKRTIQQEGFIRARG